MKLKLTLFILLIITFTACSDEVKLSKDLDGDWTIEKIESEVYVTNPTEIRVFENNGTISFDHCGRSDRKETPNNSCLGSYNMNINNENSIATFNFATRISTDSNTSEEQEYEWLTINYSEGTFPASTDLDVFGTWKIESLEKNNCTLAKQNSGAFQRIYLRR